MQQERAWVWADSKSSLSSTPSCTQPAFAQQLLCACLMRPIQAGLLTEGPLPYGCMAAYELGPPAPVRARLPSGSDLMYMFCVHENHQGQRARTSEKLSKMRPRWKLVCLTVGTLAFGAGARCSPTKQLTNASNAIMP